MTKDEAKSAEERAVFREFAAAAGLDVLPESIESRRPPEPDILCEIAGEGRVAFELVRLVDEGLAHVTARARADPEDVQGVWFGDPTLERIQENYTSPHPVELLAYGDDTLFPRNVWVPTYAEELRSLFDKSGAVFRRFWVVNLGREAASDPVWLVHPGRES